MQLPRHGAFLRRSQVAFVPICSAFALALVPARSARAADMDITPERLYVQPPTLPGGAAAAGWDCQAIARNLSGANAANPPTLPTPLFPANASPNNYPCLPNNVAWANLMSELGMAIAPPAFHPARTTGYGGFALSAEATFTSINADATAGGVQYWHQGTRGPVDPTTGRFSVTNNKPDSVLQVYSLKARKGLPFGFEVTGVLGTVANTSMWVGGADLHWALLEGYRTGLPGVLPDVAIGGGVRTLTGQSTFYLTTVGIDGQVSKPFVLGGSAVLTPYLGAQRVIIFADSAAVDLTPGVDAYQQCGWKGSNPDGTAHCTNSYTNALGGQSANSGDFNNTSAFSKARIHRWRGLAGASYRYEVLSLAGQFAMDLVEPSAENANLGITGSRQWTVSLEAGISF